MSRREQRSAVKTSGAPCARPRANERHGSPSPGGPAPDRRARVAGERPFRPRAAAIAAAMLAAAALCGRDSSAGDWPEWRGPGRAGVWSGVELPARFGDSSVTVVWRASVGGGYSGIAVAGGRVYTMDRPAPDVARERILCFDAATGERQWAHEYPADYAGMDYASGPRATPSVDRELVISVGAAGRVCALAAATGEPRWEIDLAERFQAKRPLWGHSASPLCDGDLVYLQAGARPSGTVLALDRASGAERWRALDERPGYSSPRLAELAGKRQLIVWTADAISGLEPASGRVLWRSAFRTSSFDVAIADPVIAGDRILVSGHWDGGRALRIGAAGEPLTLWEAKQPSCTMSTPLERDGHLYAIDRRRGLLCLEWATGKVLWDDGYRVARKGQNPHASMVWAGEHAAILGEDGDLILARLRPEGYQELGRTRIVGATWAHPAFSGQDVFARSDTELVCVRVDAGRGKDDGAGAPRSESR